MEAYVNPTERIPGVDREQQIWTYRPQAPVLLKVGPVAPEGLRLSTQANGSAVLNWKPVARADEYQVFRGEGELPWQAHFNLVARVTAPETTWKDKDLAPGTNYYYRVRAGVKGGGESDLSQ